MRQIPRLLFWGVKVPLGGRFEEFLNNDSNVLVPKVGMRWQIRFDEQLTLRVLGAKAFVNRHLIWSFGPRSQPWRLLTIRSKVACSNLKRTPL